MEKEPVFVAEVFPDWTTLQILESGEAYAFNRESGKVYRLPHPEAPFIQWPSEPEPTYRVTERGLELLGKGKL